MKTKVNETDVITSLNSIVMGDYSELNKFI